MRDTEYKDVVLFIVHTVYHDYKCIGNTKETKW